MHHAEKNKNVIYRLGRSVLEKYFVSVSKTSLGLRPRAVFETSTKYFPVRASHPVNNIYIFSSSFRAKEHKTKSYAKKLCLNFSVRSNADKAKVDDSWENRVLHH